MTSDDLARIIETIAVDFVLIDHTDTDDLVNIDAHLNAIILWAEEHGQEELLDAVKKCSILTNGIIKGESQTPEHHMEVLGQCISEIQSHARNEFDFKNASFPEELDSISSPTPVPHVSTESETVLHNGLKHPGNLPHHIDSELYAEFLSLQPKILDKMESLILSIEQGDASDINQLKRLIHTTKGEAGFLNLDEVERLCHLTEDLLDGKNPENHTDLLFAVIDWIRNAFYWYQGSVKSPPEMVDELLTKLDDVHSEVSDPSSEIDIISTINTITEMIGTNDDDISTDLKSATGRIAASIKTYCVRAFDYLSPDTIVNTPEVLDSVQAEALRINTLAELMGSVEIVLLSAEITMLVSAMRRDPELRKEEYCTILNESFEALTRYGNRLESASTGGTSVIKDPDIPYLIARIRAGTSGIVLEARVTAPPEPSFEEMAPPDSSLQSSESSASIPPNVSGNQIRESITVDAERLDRIIDMIGELVIAESMISQADEIKHLKSQKLTRHIAQMDKITRDLQEAGLSLRMLPIKSTFSKMARIVRDTSKKAGKEVRFAMSGEDTELDKTVVDKIGDPLMHMVRNSVDHGIEASPEDRIASGKPEHGTVTIRAFHKGGNIHIEIEDDGRGLNRDDILTKARDKGLVRDGHDISDKEIYNLIFEPGFSTASEVTDISGRGVGMNVVKDSIESLHGQVDIRSIPGKGSVFTIKIPLTLAIIDGMIVRIVQERYIIPSLSIVTSTRIDTSCVSTVFESGEMIDIQGRLVPLFVLSSLFGMTETTGQESDHLLIVVVEENDRQVAIVVDELIGKQQIVIKSLGEGMKNIPGISGAAIMPDGKVGLIIDVAGLVKLAHA